MKQGSRLGPARRGRRLPPNDGCSAPGPRVSNRRLPHNVLLPKRPRRHGCRIPDAPQDFWTRVFPRHLATHSSVAKIKQAACLMQSCELASCGHLDQLWSLWRTCRSGEHYGYRSTDMKTSGGLRLDTARRIAYFYSASDRPCDRLLHPGIPGDHRRGYSQGHWLGCSPDRACFVGTLLHA